ncbi:hypothetical protein [Roseateles sp.]|uniref:hypothetical protein n=1 Tax=Roseateles sp. TaxID=1971397 RepID=UPI00359F2DF4
MRRLVLCLLLVLLPLRGVLGGGSLGCAPGPVAMAHSASPEHHAAGHTDEHGHAAQPCKHCAPCCLAAAPPPVLGLSLGLHAPAARAATPPAEAWVGFVPPLPDPPPRR